MAITLLKFALALLIAAQGPNVPQDLKTQAISVANQAINAAQAEILAEQATPVITTVAPTVQAAPAIGGVGGPAAPACTLTAKRVYGALQDVATWQWTTENATDGVAYVYTSNKIPMNPIAEGHYGNDFGSGQSIGAASTTVTAIVNGAGGSTTCTATI